MERELQLVAHRVARQHAGRFRKERNRFEHAGENPKTYKKYLHVVRIWAAFCLEHSVFHLRWAWCDLPEHVWYSVADFIFNYSRKSARALPVAEGTIESYMTMLSHVLIMMKDLGARQRDDLHNSQKERIQKVVTEFCEVHPECRVVANTKSAWDDVLVDAGMQLLLVWAAYGHCCQGNPAWPAFARMSLAMLNYLGWRPMSLTADDDDSLDPRWHGVAVLPFGSCQLAWEKGVLVSVLAKGRRAKFRRNPKMLRGSDGKLQYANVVEGKLTWCPQVDICACLAWLVWAIAVGAFGYAPVSVGPDQRLVVDTSSPLRGPADMSCEDVDRLVYSIFKAMPDRVPKQASELPVFTGRLMGGAHQIKTYKLGSVARVVGIRLGLNPHRLGAVCGRKTLVTKVLLHSQSKEIDCTRTFGHLNPRLTSVACYLDASARNADSRSMLTGAPMRKLPGSVELAHTRNLAPDMATAHAAGLVAQAAVPLSARAYVKLNAYRKAHTAEMQRQFDEQEGVPKCGDTFALLTSFDFVALDCTKMSQAEFVAWQVKKTWGMIK